jgi:DNA-binding transcriptional LysR family regulator
VKGNDTFSKVEAMDFLENIRIFKRVAELKSFSAAAREFRVSPPTVSKAIKALEDHLRVTLLRRTTRGLSLTAEGERLLYAGGNLLEQADVMISSVRNERLALHGQLRITAALAFSRLILAPILTEFSVLHPHLKLSFHLSDRRIDLVENGIDLAVRIGEQADSTLKALRIGITRRSLYASKDYIKTFGLPKSIEDLRKHRLLCYTGLADRPVWPLHSATGEPKLFEFEPYFQSDGSDLVREMVVRGMGISLLPTWMMVEEEEHKKAKDCRVTRLLEKNSRAPLPIYAMTANTQEMTAKQRAFTDFLIGRFNNCDALSMRSAH